MRIDKAVLLDGREVPFGDFNVFIGGNGVGKTTFISELFHKVTLVARGKYFWIANAPSSSIDLPGDMFLLKGSLGRQWEGANQFFVSNAAKNVDGNVDIAAELRFSSQEIQQFATATNAIFEGVKFRRPFVAFSSCESRLGLGANSGMVSLDQPPSDPINVLFRNRALLKSIDQSIFQLFKYHLIVLAHKGTQLDFGLSKTVPPEFDANAESLQTEFEKIELWKQDNFIPITDAGHGIRSMVRLLTSLLDPVNQVVLIDEPEMHLYPSQKRWLGKQLVTLAVQQKKQVFLVTHDPMVLQGILDANTKTGIFRVDRDDAGAGTIKMCEFDRADVGHAKNQEQYLQALFYQRSVVVEGASDRSFYQEMFGDYPAVDERDLGVVVAGGVGNSKHVASLAAKIGLRTAFIYDLDVLLDNLPIMKDIYSTLGGMGNPFEKLEETFGAIKPEPGETILQALKRGSGYQRKSGFAHIWVTDNSATLNELFAQLETVGIFLVPKGALECWAPDIEEKVRFAEKAPAIVRANAELKADFDMFAKKVLSHLDIPTALAAGGG